MNRRLLSLDAFRGLTVAGMLLVNNPGQWGKSTQYAQLRHADWNGCTFTDLIFPFFLFIVGVSMVFSFAARIERGDTREQLFGHVVRRSIVLWLLGLFQSRWPLVERSTDGFTAALSATGIGGVAVRLGLVLLLAGAIVLLVGTRKKLRWWSTLGTGAALMAFGAIGATPEDLRWLGNHLADARVPGVLQRIGLCYLIASAVVLALWDRPPRRRIAILAGISVLLLILYAVGMALIPIPGFGTPDLDIGLWNEDGTYTAVFSNACAFLDSRIFGSHCLHHVEDPETGQVWWAFDPEGLVSTIPAVVTVLLGFLAGLLLRRAEDDELTEEGPPLGEPPTPVDGRGWKLILAGALGLAVVGLALTPLVALNKRLWSSSYVLFTAGAATLVLLLLYYLIETKGWRRWAMPFVWYGRNAITAFFLSSLAATLSIYLRVPATREDGTTRLITLKGWIYHQVCVPLAGPMNGSLLYAIGVVLVWMVIMGILYRRRIFLKI